MWYCLTILIDNVILGGHVMAEKISLLCSKIANKDLVLPEFQREFTWKKDQSKDLIDSLLKDYPNGSLLFWKTSEDIALKNMKNYNPEGMLEILLDGQQRLTVLYMLLRDDIPPYYSEEDIDKDPRNLHYNLWTGDLKYYKEKEMESNPFWLRVCDCYDDEKVRVDNLINILSNEENTTTADIGQKISKLIDNLNKIKNIRDKEYPIMYVDEKSNLYHALTVFDRVNSRGTPLSEADIALAHMCSAWPKTRRVFKVKLEKLGEQGFKFDLTFLTRAMNAVINGRAEYQLLHDLKEEQIAAGWKVLDGLLDYIVNFLKTRAYVYSTGDLNTNNVLIPIIGYLSKNELKFQSEDDRKKLLYWMYAALFQRRYSGSVDQKLEKDLKAIDSKQGVESLLAVLKEDEGEPQITPESLDTRGVGHPLYNMSCIVIRAHRGVDWSNGLGLEEPFGESYSIQRHHIFPKSLLKNAGYDTGNSLMHQKRVNEIANRVPLTKSGNMDIFNKPPKEYLEIVEENNPGNLKKFMIPTDRNLWRIENYEQFLAKRRKLIAEDVNSFMKRLIEDAGNGEIGPENKLNKLIEKGENDDIEFKSTLRWNIHANRTDKDIEHSVLKTIAAFLNTNGGNLIIGVSDDKKPLGLEKDQFEDDDAMLLHLVNIVKDRIGAKFTRFFDTYIEEYKGKKVLRIECRPGLVPAFVKHNNEEKFYIRTGPATNELPVSEVHEYIQDRFY
jgi:hypothetical protein